MKASRKYALKSIAWLRRLLTYHIIIFCRSEAKHYSIFLSCFLCQNSMFISLQAERMPRAKEDEGHVFIKARKKNTFIDFSNILLCLKCYQHWIMDPKET